MTARKTLRCPIDGVVAPVGDGPIDHCPVCGCGVDIHVEPVTDDIVHRTKYVGDRKVRPLNK